MFYKGDNYSDAGGLDEGAQRRNPGSARQRRCRLAMSFPDYRPLLRPALRAAFGVRSGILTAQSAALHPGYLMRLQPGAESARLRPH